MEWDDIRYFLALARSGSLSAAARQLGVTHVTVSRRIARLEEQRQVRLFDRRQKGYRLSAAGERLLKVAEEVEKACLHFDRQMLGQSDVPEGELSVSVPENALVDLSGPIAAFMRAYPGIELNVMATSVQLNLDQLQADVAIRMTDSPPELWVGRRLTEISLHLYATRDYWAEIDGDLAAANWGAWQTNPGDFVAEQYIHMIQADARVCLRTNSNSHLLAMIKQGGMLGLVAESIAQRHPELIAVLRNPIAPMGLWVLTHSDLRNAARVRCFMRFMAEQKLGQP